MAKVAYTAIKCSARNVTTVGRMKLISGSWTLLESTVYGGAIPPGEGARAVNGPFSISPEYAGCGGCGAKSYVKCGQCNRLGCWPGWGIFQCAWCGNSGAVSGQIDGIRSLD